MRAFTIRRSDIARCPTNRLDAGHYFPDGTCGCRPRPGPLSVREGDVVKIGTHRYVVVEASHNVLYTSNLGAFGAQRLQPRRGYPITIGSQTFKVNEMFRSLSTHEVETASRNGKIIYRKEKE